MSRTWSAWAPVPLRLILGIGFIYHGYPKVFSAEQREGFVQMLQGLNVPVPEAMAWVVGIAEFLGGIMLIIGLFTAFWSAILIINMLVAMFTVHLPNGFSFVNRNAQGEFGMPGYEVNLLYIGGLLALLIGGAGAASADEARRNARETAIPPPPPPPA